MTFEDAKTSFMDTVRRTTHLGGAAGLLYWDMQTIMPQKGASARAQVLGAMQTEVFRLSTADAFGEAMDALAAQAGRLNAREQRMLEEAKREYDRYKKIPADEYAAFSVATAEASHMWMAAKEQDDFEGFKPHLQKMIDYSRRFAELWGYADKPYDALLAGYDPALLTAQIDPIFEKLLAGTRALMRRTGGNTLLPDVTVPPEKQAEVGHYLLKVMGYDLEAGNLYTTEHPFTCSIHAGDIRVTTKYHPTLPMSSIFSVLHEGGHGMYEQNIDPALDGTNLFQGTSMSIHESQSRFWENIVGRSLSFWQAHLGQVNRLSCTALDTDAEHFFKAINAVQPSLIRIEADELTYNLHIIIRYECEKAIFNEGVNADALPGLWRDKYKEYLGIEPDSYATGVLQDSHWSGASFGYFPSYALGNLCAAQFAHAFEAQHGPLEGQVGTAEGLGRVAAWLKENIHRYGAEKKPADIMQAVCGEDINPRYFLDYMEKKLARVYGWQA